MPEFFLSKKSPLLILHRFVDVFPNLFKTGKYLLRGYILFLQTEWRMDRRESWDACLVIFFSYWLRSIKKLCTSLACNKKKNFEILSEFRV